MNRPTEGPSRTPSAGAPLRIALVTARTDPDLCPDDRVLLRRLVAQHRSPGAMPEVRRDGGAVPTRDPGVIVEIEIWDDPEVDWEAYDVVVIRSTWDYATTPQRRDEYVAWARKVESTGATLLNPAHVVDENTHKRYLLDLAAEDVPVVPTVLLERGARADLDAIVAGRGWAGVVVKPAVGAAGRDTWRCDTSDVHALERVRAGLERSLAKEDMLVQPFVESVLAEGEISYTWIDGRFTHAVRKRAAPGEFRVQDDHGGTVERVPMREAWLRVAEASMAPFIEEVSYARVDLVADPEGAPLVMELELVEPELFFRFDDAALDRFVKMLLHCAPAASA